MPLRLFLNKPLKNLLIFSLCASVELSQACHFAAPSQAPAPAVADAGAVVACGAAVGTEAAADGASARAAPAAFLAAVAAGGAAVAAAGVTTAACLVNAFTAAVAAHRAVVAAARGVAAAAARAATLAWLAAVTAPTAVAASGGRISPGSGKELPFRHPCLLPSLLPLSPPSAGWTLAALCISAQMVCTGEVKALVATARLKNQPGPSACNNANLPVLRQEAGTGPMAG